MSLVLRGPGRSVTIDPPTLLAPMEGVTDACFRSLAAGLGGLGAVVTEFVRVTTAPVPVRVLRRDLGAPLPIPAAVQLMAADERHLSTSVVNAERAGAAWVDLNFGCPAPVVFGKCAGAALLDHPDRLTAIVRTAAQATSLPVTAKLRAGIRDPGRVAELVCAAAEAGAAAITLHARLRVQPYEHPATWDWLAQAAVALRGCARPVPLIGNGGIETAADIARMRAETGCAAVMVGRAAFADPFLFRVAAGGPPADRDEAVAFAIRYLEAIGGGGPKGKQFARWYRAAGLLADREERWRLLRGDPDAILAWFRQIAGSSTQNTVPAAASVAKPALPPR